MHSFVEPDRQVEILVDGVSMVFGKKGQEVTALRDVQFQVVTWFMCRTVLYSMACLLPVTPETGLGNS
ncbi:hypothetical protein [Paenibacillus rigui]|uniref:Uncharacterized protein n=1 Tax=Paenibacillus rigui TaxID=554312 RepID=A0A229UWN4_9BACL|nr:hypothetical protein [Paenibacillus rigui]OXM87733.1 hypothetical protein CF651_01020 [Paenibacillus rigui]